MASWPVVVTALQLIGSALEVIGVVLMANGLIAVVRRRDLAGVLLSAFLRGKAARGAARMTPLTADDQLSTLQGLAFILAGFVAQGLASVLALVMSAG